ncbi:N-carbamoyl-D-amino acid hydrolase [Pelomyxa schiedti]|nr:N-carbamoyl-D-amino acid hydrolase [Pelomyxa schiedti]
MQGAREATPATGTGAGRADASNVVVAALQMACVATPDGPLLSLENAGRMIERVTRLIRVAAAPPNNANVVILPELFENRYFCQDMDPAYFELASTLEENKAVQALSALARELAIVIPVSFFEKCNNAFFNSVAVLDADGSILGVYRKSHIPHGPGYQEKYYFSPGDTGFKVYKTRYCNLGVGICWDQWFPEAARVMALQGADLIAYPTAIGSEPSDPTYFSGDHWTRVMQGHSAANMLPVVAANRVGTEEGMGAGVSGGMRGKSPGTSSMSFYGRSFITDETGAVITSAPQWSPELPTPDESILVATFDFPSISRKRAAWGLFRDRRPTLYNLLLSL